MKKTELGQRLIVSLQEALEHVRGRRKLRTTIFYAVPAKAWSKEDIARLRTQRFKMSQPVFASYLSVTASTVRAWEQGLKSPSGAARRLLDVAEMKPEIFQMLTGRLTQDDMPDLRAAQKAWMTHSQVADRAAPARTYFSKRPRREGRRAR